MRDHMDPVLGRALEDEFAKLTATTPVSSTERRSSRGPGTRVQALWVTVAVGVVVVITAVFAINAGQYAAPPAVSPTSSMAATETTSTTLSRTALQSKLPTQQYGRTIHTWTDQDPSNSSGPFRFVGSTAVIAAVCDGGGSIAITDTGGSVHKEGCTRLDVQQPFWKFNMGGDGKSTKTTGPVHVTVKVLSGTPRYIVRLWAVDPRILDSSEVSVAATSPAVPRSLRSCTAVDLAPSGSVERAAGTSSGVVTITSRSATDCAIRDWPTMQYLAAGGVKVGPLEGKDNNGKSLDSTEGKLDKYGQFPPARLTAGGSAYLIVDLVTMSKLQKEDAQQKAMPTPTKTTGPVMPALPLCDPKRITSIKLGIGDATVTVPTSDALDVAACTTSTRAFGVNPVVAERPAVER